MLLGIVERETERRRTSTAVSGEASRLRWRSRTWRQSAYASAPRRRKLLPLRSTSKQPMARRGLVIVLASLVAVPSAFGGPEGRQAGPPGDQPAARRVHSGGRRAEGPETRLAARRRRRARRCSYRQWLTGNTSVQTYPAKGTAFHGWILNYSYPGDVGFDILLQSRNPKQGAWSFRAEAQKLGGRWKITTWYPVAEFAPPGQTQRVNGPADLGRRRRRVRLQRAKAASAPWVLAIPVAVHRRVDRSAHSAFAGTRWWRRRKRVRAIERSLASDR